MKTLAEWMGLHFHTLFMILPQKNLQAGYLKDIEPVSPVSDIRIVREAYIRLLR